MKDLFSLQSKNYSTFRPTYPKELFQYLSSLVRDHTAAWDPGTGNGQAAIQLAEYFSSVYATDMSDTQIQNAWPHPKVHYQISTAEKSNLKSRSVSLITVAQAIHWFDHEKFYSEVRRVSLPNESVIAAWCYSTSSISPEVDPIINRFYTEIVGPYWEPERKWIDERLKTIPFPFQEITSPSFELKAMWSFNHLIGYFESWSSTQNYIKLKKSNPIDQIHASLLKVWGGDPKSMKEVRWIFSLRVGHL